ncbi:hypothetical protein AAHC03_021194 [Spirometra sp. Aus1]
MRGLGTDEKAIIAILGRRTSAERFAIREAYKATFDKKLEDALHGELSGKFRSLAKKLTKTPWEVMAKALYKAMQGPGTRERVLVEVLATCSNDDIVELKKAYQLVLEAEGKSKDRTLEGDVDSDTSGDFREALRLLLSGKRDEPTALQLKNLTEANVHELVNAQLAETDAKEIYASGEGRPGTNEKRFMRPILSRTLWQLNATNEAYKRLYGRSLYDAIKNETSGDFRELLLAVLTYALDRPQFISDTLRASMAGAGTRDSMLMRQLVLRSDLDLESVKRKFEEINGQSLEQWITDDTSGDYQRLCLALAASPNDV